MWQPSSGFGPSDRDTFLKNHGMNDADFEMVKEAMVDVKRMIAQEHDREVIYTLIQIYVNNSPLHNLIIFRILLRTVEADLRIPHIYCY